VKQVEAQCTQASIEYINCLCSLSRVLLSRKVFLFL